MEVDKFYAWLLKCKNIYLADNIKMTRAFEIAATQNKRCKLNTKNNA